MADNKNRNRAVDDAGIRLAPAPMKNESIVALPSISQQFVISPELYIDEPMDDAPKTHESTADDFQPKTEDVSKKWKRRRRSKNIVVGIVMLAISAVILLQYILGALGGVGDKLNFIHFVLIPKDLGAINNIVHAVKDSIASGWTSNAARTAWLHCVPSLMLSVGIIAVFVNFLKAITGTFGAVKPRKYILSAVIYLLMATAVLIIYLVGAPALNIARVDFVADIIKGYQTSEILSIMVFALGYLIISVVCSWIASEKYGYLK